jgi:hypothetical protein
MLQSPKILKTCTFSPIWPWISVFITASTSKPLGAIVVISNSPGAEHWRRRAGEMRSIAEQLGVLARAKTAMLRVAEEYDRLAAVAERRLKAQPA